MSYTNQLRQVLMYWPEKQKEPTMKLSVADAPLARTKREPDAILDLDMPGGKLVIYYWGSVRDHGLIVSKASWGWVSDYASQD